VHAVVGLGNPGSHYCCTRHNVGFLVADELANGSRWAESCGAHTARTRLVDEDVLVIKPQTYMNRSGDALLALSEAEGFGPEDILVVLDDFLLEFGRVRLRRAGSDGGHNGLASVLERFRTDEVTRLRIGVGPVPAEASDIDFVLAPFSTAEDVDGLVERGVAAVRCWLQAGIETAMNRFNGCQALPSRATD
jgi:peptidyl-tRNA hydrolase, PTH1 family